MLKLKAFLFAVRLTIKVIPTYIRVHMNHYIMAKTNIWNVKAMRTEVPYEVVTPTTTEE